MLTYERPAHEGLDQSHHRKISVITLRRALPQSFQLSQAAQARLRNQIPALPQCEAA